MNASPVRATGTILEVLPSALFRIRLDDGNQVLGTPTREAARVWTKFSPGDRVSVELSPFAPTRGRITARL